MVESNVKILNEHLNMVFAYWDGEISEEEFLRNRKLHISKEVDSEMQKDSFY